MARPKKPEGETVARMGITLPQELKQAMEDIPERDAVNWSAVAAEAFRCKLTRLQSERTGATMTEVIERMRAAHAADNDEAYQHGREAGAKWVKQHARPKHLMRLSGAVHSMDGSAVKVAFIVATYLEHLGESRGENPSVGIFWDMFAADRKEPEDVAPFWEDEVGLGASWRVIADDTHFAQGFVEAVIELWIQIAAKL